MWNKWATILRRLVEFAPFSLVILSIKRYFSRPWNLMERVCSINPPPYFVEHVDDQEYIREIDISSANTIHSIDPWFVLCSICRLRYLVVVDSRQSDFSSIDITKLADKATSDYDRTPYYITGSLTPEQVHNNIEFKLGDGLVYGGYLNYPLRENHIDPRWTLIPMSQIENEIMEPRLRTCGFTEDGAFECDMSILEFISHLPWLVKSLLIIGFSIIVFFACVLAACGLRRLCENPNRTVESSIMYYHNDSPNTQSISREYRKVEKREFKASDMEERMRFMEE
uniref:DUF4793 domain-containing protein n=1 Tax=Heterorhabditis bacteriophora TaxID=37862 RepID=A0A1I7XEK6_HETBA